MKIHLSTTEATEIIKTFFNLPDDAQIVINQPIETTELFAGEDPRMVEIVKKYGPESKIHSVKEIRQTIGGGLKDTIIIVERIIEKLKLANYGA